MGKKGKDKKKGKGAEKTAAKTDKKLSNKMKKELQKMGEDDIENIVAQIEREEKKRLEITEITVDTPSRRVNFSFIPHPDKEQLILYGGEFFNGQKTFVYNDLFFYNIPTNTWTVLKVPNSPPSRCGHQMVATSSNKGQLWLFGGEFVSPTQSQFYHYRDLWVYHINQKQWEKITTPNGPSARSGHRMVYLKKNLIIFGGFHDNLRDYKYFNDVYAFNTETYKWLKMEVSGTPPAPRSACCMVGLNDGRILIYGGYSKERIKKDVDKGHVFTDSFVLSPDKNDSTGTKWKWIQVKLGGSHFSPRCSMPMTATPNNLFAYCYGGVFDVEDDEENLAGNFYNDFYQLDLEKFAWKNVVLKDKDAKMKKKLITNDSNDTMEIEEIEESVKTTTISDDGVFKVTVGPALLTSSSSTNPKVVGEETKLFQPSPRINCGLAVKHGVLYLYGGMIEDGDKQLTLKDFYAIDLKKMDEWKCLISDENQTTDWLGSDSDSSEGSSDEDSNEDDDSNDDEEDDDEMETQ